jgi:shikimate dehydrogenase
MSSNAVPAYAVIGNPIKHSWSPWIHAQLGKYYGLNLQYKHILADTEDYGYFEELNNFFKQEHAYGVNITMPFKHEACIATGIGGVPTSVDKDQADIIDEFLADHPDSRPWFAELTRSCLSTVFRSGSVNTLMCYPDLNKEKQYKDIGFNTDAKGLQEALRTSGIAEHLQEGARVLVLGAGATVRTVLASMEEILGLKQISIDIVNRSAERAWDLVYDYTRPPGSHGGMLPGISLPGISLSDYAIGELPNKPYSLLINTTSAGHSGDVLDPGNIKLNTNCYALDLSYGKAAEPFKQLCLKLGCPAGRFYDGIPMLVHQAHYAFLIWRYRNIDSLLLDESGAFLNTLISDLQAKIKNNENPPSRCMVVNGKIVCKQ